MKNLYSEGKTLVLLKSPLTGALFRVSIVSKRAARIICVKSMNEKWGRPTAVFYPKLKVNSFILCGFQPETGNHIAYYEPPDILSGR